jgi:phosphate-selective porin OprO/OprP
VKSPVNKKTFVLTTLTLAITAASHQAHALTATERQLLEQVRILSEKVAELERKSSPAATADTRKLDQKVRILERKLELADEETAKNKANNPIITASEKGFSIKSPDADKSFELKFRGLAQADARIFEGDSIRGQPSTAGVARDGKDDFLLRRVRPTIEGTVFKDYDFKITYDFGNNQSTLIDAYIDSRLADKAAVLRVGKFTPPLGLEHIQGSSSLKFNENSLPSNFAPSRDIGLQLGGKVFSETLEYAVGIFNGALDGSNGDRDANTDKDLAARVFYQPLANSPGLFQNFSFGVAASLGDADGRSGETNLASYRTAGQENFFSFDSATYAKGTHDRVIPQFTWYAGSFGLLGEYADVKQDVVRGTRDDSLDLDAWSLTASYLLTGEEASFKGVKPNKGSSGAWELIARTGSLEIDKDAFSINGQLAKTGLGFADPRTSAQQVDSWAVGVNWYPNTIVRASLNYEKASFDLGGGIDGSGNLKDRKDEKVITGRLQAAF